MRNVLTGLSLSHLGDEMRAIYLLWNWLGSEGAITVAIQTSGFSVS